MHENFKVEIIRTINKAVNSKNDENQQSSDYLPDRSIGYEHQSDRNDKSSKHHHRDIDSAQNLLLFTAVKT
jgi:hypothetical protein